MGNQQPIFQFLSSKKKESSDDKIIQIINPIIYLTEQWLPITSRSAPEIKPGAYMISSMGRVYSNFSNKILCPSVDSKGYNTIHLSNINGSRTYRLHRLEMLEFCPIPNADQYQINHKDGNKTNNVLTNLEWCDQSYNIKHADQNGLRNMPKGENVHNCTITNEQAETIAQLITEDSWTYDEIAEMIGCTRHPVADIARGRCFPYLYEKYNLKSHKHKGKRFNLHKLIKE